MVKINQTDATDELVALSEFTKLELDKTINALELLLKQNGYTDSSLTKDIANMTSKIILDLPKLQNIYLKESVEPLKRICLLIAEFIQKNPQNQTFSSLFLETVNQIASFIHRFNLPEDLSLTPLTNSDDGIDARTLKQKVINPNFDDSKEYTRMIRQMVDSTKQRNLTNDNMRAVSDGILATYEGKDDDRNPTRDAVTDLLLSSVARLHERQAELNLAKQRVTQLSNSYDTISPKEAKKRKIESLSHFASQGVIETNSD